MTKSNQTNRNKSTRAAVIKGSIAVTVNKRLPHSLLQRINTAVHWAVHFKLLSFNYSGLRELKMSDKTRSLIIDYNSVTADLQDSLQDDYEAQKAEILAAREADKEAVKQSRVFWNLKP